MSGLGSVSCSRAVFLCPRRAKSLVFLTGIWSPIRDSRILKSLPPLRAIYCKPRNAFLPRQDVCTTKSLPKGGLSPLQDFGLLHPRKWPHQLQLSPQSQVDRFLQRFEKRVSRIRKRIPLQCPRPTWGHREVGTESPPGSSAADFSPEDTPPHPASPHPESALRRCSSVLRTLHGSGTGTPSKASMRATSTGPETAATPLPPPAPRSIQTAHTTDKRPETLRYFRRQDRTVRPTAYQHPDRLRSPRVVCHRKSNAKSSGSKKNPTPVRGCLTLSRQFISAAGPPPYPCSVFNSLTVRSIFSFANGSIDNPCTIFQVFPSEVRGKLLIKPSQPHSFHRCRPPPCENTPQASGRTITFAVSSAAFATMRALKALAADHRGPSLLNSADKVILQPVLIFDHRRRRLPVDLRVIKVRELRRTVIPPDCDVAHRRNRLTRFLARLLETARFSSSLVIAYQRSFGNIRSILHRDQAVGIARIADHHHHAHVTRRHLADRFTGVRENRAVDPDQVRPLHSRLAGHAPRRSRSCSP